MHRRSLVFLTVLVLAQAATQEFKGETKVRPVVPPIGPRGGFWAAPPGESGASRHAPRPGPGDVPPAVAEEVPEIELESGRGANAGD